MPVGDVYLLRGERLTLLALGGGRRKDPTRTPNRMVGTGLCQDAGDPSQPTSRSPRNALLEREDGSRFVRPFRGLRAVRTSK